MRAIFAVMLCCFATVTPAGAAPVLWTIEEGGNGHYYDIVVNPAINWNNAQSAAASLSYLGSQGHLATITSSAENAFVATTFGIPGQYGRFALGGTESGGWITGEPFSYSNWAPGEPNSSEENAIVMYLTPPGDKFSNGVWNDLSSSENLNGGYIVEFSGPFSAVPEPSSVLFVTIAAIAGATTSAKRTRRLLAMRMSSMKLSRSPVVFGGLLGIVLMLVGDARAGIHFGPIVNPANNHTYFVLTANSSWYSSQGEAVSLGGNLATINDAAENDWVVETFHPMFSSDPYQLWIGLNDVAEEGLFSWVSGEPVTYTNWSGGEPNNEFGEDFVHIIGNGFHGNPPGKWNDAASPPNIFFGPYYGLVEVSASVPEPTSAVFISIGLIGAYIRRQCMARRQQNKTNLTLPA